MEGSTDFAPSEDCQPIVREDILKGLSEDILSAICHQWEPSPADNKSDDIVLLKHKKNKNTLTLACVCKSWYQRLTVCKPLFQDIAFHVSSSVSIATARLFLDFLKGSETPTYVYANLGCMPDPKIAELFAGLRPRLEYVVHFEYRGEMCRYRSLLDSPAPNLRFFSNHTDQLFGRGAPLFRGHAPKLQTLTTLTSGPEPIWITSTLSDLTFLQLGFLESGFQVPLSSFLKLLRGSPRLETIIVRCFEPIIRPGEPLPIVSLPRLQTLYLIHNEPHFIIKHLRIPSAHKVMLMAHRGTNPTFHARHALDGFPPLPAFEQKIEKLDIETGERGEFFFDLQAEGGFHFSAWLVWLDVEDLFEDYVARTIMELAEKITVAPEGYVRVCLQHSAASSPLLYQNLLLVNHIDRLTIQGGIAGDVLGKLGVGADGTLLLPRLKHLEILDSSPLVDEEGREALLSCLQSRRGSSFSICLANKGLPDAVFADPQYIVTQNKPPFVTISLSRPVVALGL